MGKRDRNALKVFAIFYVRYPKFLGSLEQPDFIKSWKESRISLEWETPPKKSREPMYRQTMAYYL